MIKHINSNLRYFLGRYMNFLLREKVCASFKGFRKLLIRNELLVTSSNDRYELELWTAAFVFKKSIAPRHCSRERPCIRLSFDSRSTMITILFQSNRRNRRVETFTYDVIDTDEREMVVGKRFLSVKLLSLLELQKLNLRRVREVTME